MNVGVIGNPRYAGLAAILPGMAARAKGLRVTLLSEPPLLVLDEPFDGLDPPSREVLTDLLTESAASGAAVIVSTLSGGDAGYGRLEAVVVPVAVFAAIGGALSALVSLIAWPARTGATT